MNTKLFLHSDEENDDEGPRIAPFLITLRNILECEHPGYMRWSADGKSFEIPDLEAMTAIVLPKYFKHTKLASFQRQLNYFGFRKWTKSQAKVCTFSNPMFTRYEPHLAVYIRRKKRKPSISKPNQVKRPKQPMRELPEPIRDSRDSVSSLDSFRSDLDDLEWVGAIMGQNRQSVAALFAQSLAPTMCCDPIQLPPVVHQSTVLYQTPYLRQMYPATSTQYDPNFRYRMPH